MSAKPTCSYVFEKYGEKYPCSHEAYQGQDTCVFHSPNVHGKAEDFKKAFRAYKEHCEEQESIKFYDFQGFLFPLMGFNKFEFQKNADFSFSTFLGDADFRESTFSGDADFRESTFSRDADFRECTFSGFADFSSSTFLGDADFISSTFSGNAYFSSSTFSRIAYFSESTFSGDAYFRSSTFPGGADLRESTFKGIAQFSACDFSILSDFSTAQFHKVLQMEQAHITLQLEDQKELRGINFQGVVIDEACLYGMERLEGYSFQDSFLLSMSLAGREVIDCDFTGAVIDAVRTRDWKPDIETLRKTKYIYTDCTVEKVVDEESGKERLQYKPLLESRVPASGNFGEGEHENFTIKDYLKERYRWSRGINLPVAIRTAVLNYIHFFSDFVRLTEGLDVQILTKPEGGKVRVEFQADSKEDKARVEERFEEYLQKSQTTDLENLDIQFSKNSEANALEQKVLMVDMKRQIAAVQDKLNFTQLLLDSEKEKVELLKNSESNLVQVMELWKNNPSQLLDASPALPTPPATKTQYYVVAKGDIVGFSSLMKQGRGTAITKAFESIVKSHDKGLIYAEVSGGDSLLLLSSTPSVVLKAAKRIQEDLAEIPGKPQLRLALDFGEIDYEDQDGFKLRGGAALRTTARIEPLVTPGEIWCTESFKTILEKNQPSPQPELLKEDLKKLGSPNKDGKYNIAKQGSNEKPEWMSLYRVN